MRLLLLLACLLAAPRALLSGQETSAELFSRVEASVFTVEIHTGNQEAKSSLGSGYLVAPDGRVITNYHVVSSFIDDPKQNRVRVRNVGGARPATLLAFDIENDLALLKVEGLKAPPLPMAAEVPPSGARIVALGNPHGLRLSIVEGIFNGSAEKGLVDRMVLSMPLNSGMSGGPILNEHGRVIGTNVAIYRASNSLSFGVPLEKLAKLLEAPAVASSEEALRAEMHRQLLDLEKRTATLLREKLETTDKVETVTVGGAELPRPPSMFECWENTKKYEEAAVLRARYRCDLQFTPSVGDDEEVGVVEIDVEHVSSKRNRYGFFGWLSENGSAQVDSDFSGTSERRTSPRCSVERVEAGGLHFKVNTCLRGYVEHEGLYDFSLAATSLDRPREAITIALQLKGFKREAFALLARWILESIRFTPGS